MKVPFSIEFATNRAIPWRLVKYLYDSVGWWPKRDEKEIQAVLGSSIAAGAWLNHKLVGFARAVSDGRCRAYLEDIVVHPDFQHQGIGSVLLASLIKELPEDTISLFCDDSITAFYTQFGFKLTSQRVLHLKQDS